VLQGVTVIALWSIAVGQSLRAKVAYPAGFPWQDLQSPVTAICPEGIVLITAPVNVLLTVEAWQPLHEPTPTLSWMVPEIAVQFAVDFAKVA
jgi:hypothetical protein